VGKNYYDLISLYELENVPALNAKSVLLDLLVESMSDPADVSRLQLPMSRSASRIYLSDIRAHFRLHSTANNWNNNS
jgi:hypothetical protein